jgi:hypothetical protein
MSAATSLRPRVDRWLAHLQEAMRERGHSVEPRISRRYGSTFWHIDGGRALTTFEAARKMERIIYGRENP